MSNLRPMLDVSTSNLTENDTHILTAMAEGSIKEMGLPRTLAHDYGFIMFVNGDVEELAGTVDAMRNVGLSENVAHIYREGEQVRAMLINFDADADPVDGLPAYDW